MAKKTMNIRGKQVDVEDFDLPPMAGEAPSKLLRATVGGVTVERTLTFGAVDGPRSAVTVADIQKDLDDARQRLANEAAWRSELASLLQQVL